MNSSSSFEDEIAEIERSARGEFTPPQNNNLPFNHTNAYAPPRTQGASFMASAYTAASKDFLQGDSLVEFQSRGVSSSSSQATMDGSIPLLISSSGKARQRNSVSINSIAMRGALAGLADVDDSDDDDDGEQSKKVEEASSHHVSNPKASGGPDHRPLIGGFAAAAYEAARVDHYKKQGKEVNGHYAPKPRAHYPRHAA